MAACIDQGESSRSERSSARELSVVPQSSAPLAAAAQRLLRCLPGIARRRQQALLIALLSVVLALQAAPGEAAYAPAGVLGKTGGGVFRFPQAIAFDASGVDDPGVGAPGGPYLYVADQHSFLVQKFTTDGTFVRRIGGFGTGADASGG
jgi:uncharacterized membrane protein